MLILQKKAVFRQLESAISFNQVSSSTQLSQRPKCITTFMTTLMILRQKSLKVSRLPFIASFRLFRRKYWWITCSMAHIISSLSLLQLLLPKTTKPCLRNIKDTTMTPHWKNTCFLEETNISMKHISKTSKRSIEFDFYHLLDISIFQQNLSLCMRFKINSSFRSFYKSPPILLIVLMHLVTMNIYYV
jgi:hypothetical protein